MALPLHTLDVFTDRRFCGNPLAVVSDADALSTEQMQSIARELNLSETAFVLKPSNPAHSARVRFFTPARELSFAGHPTIGTAILLAQARTPLVNGESDVIILLEQAIGSVRVGVRLRDGQAPFAEFDAPKLPEKAKASPPARDRIADALGLLPREIGFENHNAMCLTAGNTFAFVPVATLEAIGKAHIERARWDDAFGDDIAGVYLYTRECIHNRFGLPRAHVCPAARRAGGSGDRLGGGLSGRRRARLRRLAGRHAQAGHRAGPRNGAPKHHRPHPRRVRRQARNGPHRRQRRARHRRDAGPRSPADQLEIGKA